MTPIVSRQEAHHEAKTTATVTFPVGSNAGPAMGDCANISCQTVTSFDASMDTGFAVVLWVQDKTPTKKNTVMCKGVARGLAWLFLLKDTGRDYYIT